MQPGGVCAAGVEAGGIGRAGLALAASLVTCLCFGIVPALGSTGVDPAAALKEGGRASTAGRRQHRLRHGLVVGEVALSFALVDGALVVAATPRASITARNVESTRRARLAFGELRDVVVMDVTASAMPWTDAEPRLVEHFVRTRDWDPTVEPHEFVMLVLQPVRVQAWRSVEEIAGRELMRAGHWLDASAPQD